MVVPAHSLVAPAGSNGRSMVISSLLKEHFNVFSFMSVFLRERTQHVIIAAKKFIVYHQLKHSSLIDQYAGLQNHHASLWDEYICFWLVYHVYEVECFAVCQQNNNPNYATKSKL